MTPEKKFNQDIWWILQEIRKDEFLAPKGERVEFSIRTLPKTKSIKRKDIDYSIPHEDTQRKLLYKLKEWKAIDDLEVIDDIIQGSSLFNPQIYKLSIKQPKFSELYRLYESGGNYSENQKTASEPKNSQSIIKPKSLELIAREIGELDTHTNLIKFLTECGVEPKLIQHIQDEYSTQSKWQLIYAVLSELATSPEQKYREIVFKIIGNAVHPLMHRGDKSSAEALREKFNNYLSYDNLDIFYAESEGVYKVAKQMSREEESEMLAETAADFEAMDKEQLEFLCKPENREKISLLRKAFQSLMDVVYAFCENPAHPTLELNDAYKFLDGLVWKSINDIGLGLTGKNSIRNFNNYTTPFINLFAAEKHYREQNKELSWRKIRPEMNAMYGDIEELYQEVSGSDVIAEPDKQKKLNEIQLYLSTLKKKREMAKKMVRGRHSKAQANVPNTQKIEIEGLREGLEAIARSQKGDNKPKFPYKLPAGTKWEEITIKFVDDENVFIQVKQFKHTASYKELGLVGRGKNPNPSELWAFLKVLAQKNGELAIKDTEARDKYKKQKELLAKSLQFYFSLDYDPFYPYRSSSEKQGNSYKIKITLIPLSTENQKLAIEENDDDNLGVKEYLKEQAPQINKE